MTAGSASTLLFQGGSANGLSSTADPRVSTPWTKKVQVSANAKDITFTVPNGSYLERSVNFVTVAVSSLGQGAKILLGDGVTDNLYGTTNAVVASGQYISTLTEAAVSCATISVKVTASVAASASGFTQGKITVMVVGGITNSQGI